MSENKTYQVKELGELANVSIRTLHHYDQIGLLKAKRNLDNGYRFYTLDDAVRLQQIVFYRQLDFSLDEIRSMLTTSKPLIESLKAQHSALIQRQTETQLIIENLEIAMGTLRGEQNIDILFSSLPDERAKNWKANLLEADKKGGGKIVQAYSNFSESEMAVMSDESAKWCKKYADIVSLKTGDKSVQSLIGEVYIMVNKVMDKVMPEQPDKYLDEKGFREYAKVTRENRIIYEMHEEYARGFAEHLYLAMLFFCDNELKENRNNWKERVYAKR